jgi:hypothetical protein
MAATLRPHPTTHRQRATTLVSCPLTCLLLACGTPARDELGDGESGTGESGGEAQCDLSCPAEGIVEGNTSITGVSEFDTYFVAVVDVSGAAIDTANSLRLELDAIAVSLGVPDGVIGADIAAAINAKIAASTDSGLHVSDMPITCAADTVIAIGAAAACDAEFDPAAALGECEGACQIGGGVQASCDGDATLICTGAAPNLACQGSCTGNCELDVASDCGGICRGSCFGNCSVIDAQGDCAGECDGACQGTCELEVGGACSGSCRGSCTYEPVTNCEADATAKCQAGVDATVECDRRCEGRLVPPPVEVQCQATVAAKTAVGIHCDPPPLQLTWQWSLALAGDVAAQREFEVWLHGLEQHLARMLAAKARADLLIEALTGLANAGVGALPAVVGLYPDPASNFKVNVCGLPEVEDSLDILDTAASILSTEASATVDVFGSIGLL